MVVTANSIWVNPKPAPVGRTQGLEKVLHHPECTARMFHHMVDAAMHSMVFQRQRRKSNPNLLFWSRCLNR